MALAHAGLGWAIGVAVPGSDRRIRIWCAAAALLPEIDRLAALVVRQAPPFGHNIFAGVLCMGAAAWFFRDHPNRSWLTAFWLVGFSFAAHLALDAMLSGAELRPFWPLSGRGRRFQPLLPSTVTLILGGVLAALPVALAFWKQVTPLEIISERLDGLFLNLFRSKNRECRVCGKACNNRCLKCRQPVCLRHGRIGWRFRMACEPCRRGSAPKAAPAGVEDYLALQLSFLRSKEAIRLDPEFASFLHRKLTDGLRRLDDVPRTHPLWQGSDLRPTLAKLVDLSRTVLKDAPDDDESRWVLFADRILTNSPDLEFSVIEPTILRDFGSIRWLVAAARWRYAFSGINPVIALRRPFESLGKTVGPMEPFLQALQGDPSPATREAAARCLELLQGRNPFTLSTASPTPSESRGSSPTRVPGGKVDELFP